MDEVQIRIRLDDDASLAAALEAAEEQGATAETVSAPAGGGVGQQFAPVVAILIGAGVIAAAKIITDWWERVRGGLVVDQRPGAADMIYRDADVPFGYVLVFPTDGGSVKVEVKDAPKDAMQAWISEVISGGLKTVSELAKAAKEVAGAGKVDVEASAS